jgi:hypothetical protein
MIRVKGGGEDASARPAHGAPEVKSDVDAEAVYEHLFLTAASSQPIHPA